MSIQVNTYGPKNGMCNICGVVGPLTEDHTPPKGCYRPTQVEIRHLTYVLSGVKDLPKGRRSQNGVKYRTLCPRCNNNLLGSKYDPPFIDFVNSTAALLQNKLSLPTEIAIPGKPQAIVRALIGHMSAQGVNRYLKGPLTEDIRDYFLDDTLPLPTGVRVFYWVYPHRGHVMFRDAAYAHIPSQKHCAIWLLKFYPLAFLITWDEPIGLNFPINSFDPWRNASISQVADIPLGLYHVPPLLWPEAPTNETLLMYGQEAIHVAG